MISSTVTAVILVIASTQFCLAWGQGDKAYEAQADFAVSLLQEASKTGKSAVLSPFSITTALAMVLAGAEGQTKQQIIDVLAKGVSFPEFGTYLKNLFLDTSSGEGQKYTLDVANRVYAKQQADISSRYLELLRRVFRVELKKVDFQQKDSVAKEINSWVASATHDKIKDLISADSIDKDTVMMLLNAVYFKGTWQTQFNKTDTRNKPFQIAAGKEKEVPMMSVKSEFPYFEDQSVQVLGLPYDGDQVEMFLILPKTRFGLASVLNGLSGQKLLEYIRNTYFGSVEVQVPRFKLEKKLELVEMLEKLGITDLFTVNANLRYISGDPLRVSDVTHKAFIEVNEEGTEAAAATSVVLVPRSGFAARNAKFIADQPFLFAIVKGGKNVLFVGQVAE